MCLSNNFIFSDFDPDFENDPDVQRILSHYLLGKNFFNKYTADIYHIHIYMSKDENPMIQQTKTMKGKTMFSCEQTINPQPQALVVNLKKYTPVHFERFLFEYFLDEDLGTDSGKSSS